MMYIKPLNKTHEQTVIELLQSHHLPIVDIDLEKQTFAGIFDNETLQAIGGLEIYDNEALLRSVAVHSENIRKGFGFTLVRYLIELATEKKIKCLFLLTESATDFFLRSGFKVIDRSKVPEIIRNSSQFKELCSESATCMALKIKANKK